MAFPMELQLYTADADEGRAVLVLSKPVVVRRWYYVKLVLLSKTSGGCPSVSPMAVHEEGRAVLILSWPVGVAGVHGVPYDCRASMAVWCSPCCTRWTLGRAGPARPELACGVVGVPLPMMAFPMAAEAPMAVWCSPWLHMVDTEEGRAVLVLS